MIDKTNEIAELVEGATPSPPREESPREGRQDDFAGFDEDVNFSGGDPISGGEDIARPDLALLSCARAPQNDIGNSLRFRIRYGDLSAAGLRAVHVQNIGWYCWNGQRWREDIDNQGMKPLRHGTAEAIALEVLVMGPTEQEAAILSAAVEAAEKVEALSSSIAELASEKGDEAKIKIANLKKKLETQERLVQSGEIVEKRIARRKSDRLRHANASGNKGKLDAMISEALPSMSRRVRDFDTAELDLNVENGTVFAYAADVPDLECPDPTAERMVKKWRIAIRAHERLDFNSKLAPVVWCPESRAPTFDAFLAQIMPSAELRDYLRRFFGYTLTRRTSEQTFCIFHGEGSNGKSTLIDIIAKILDDYATTIPISSLLSDNARKGQEATPDLAKIPGARFLRTSEPSEGLGLNEALIKELTGGEPINIRRLNAEFVEVYPEFKLVISCNRKPKIVGNDDGIWRRIALVPFDVQIPKNKRDKHLKEKLWAERSGILNWMIEGLLDYLSRGSLDAPEEILKATKDWQSESDSLGQFVRAALDVTRDPTDKVETGGLYDSYVIYAKRSSLTPIQATTFNRRFPRTAAEYGITKGKSSLSLYEGVRFKPDFDPSRTRFAEQRG